MTEDGGAPTAAAPVVMGTLGRVEEYEHHKEDWPQYVERLSHFFEAKRKRSVFLAVVGATTYKVLRDLVAPSKPGDIPFEELVQKLEEHFSPKPSEIVERFRFHTRSRKPGESVANFIASLRALSEHCNFGTVLEDMLRDRLVCGVNDDTTQKRLLAEPNLTYKRAVEIARGLETADKNIKLLRNGGKKDHGGVTSGDANLHRVTASLTCYCCGKVGHTAPKCKVTKDIVCRKCGKTGHMQRACLSQKGTGPKKESGLTRSKPVWHMEDEEGSTTLLHVRSESAVPPLQVPLLLDGCEVTMELDTGATMTLMSEDTFRILWPGRSLDKCKVRLCSYSKQPIPVMGKCNVNITYKDQQGVNLPLIIVKGPGPSLLGRAKLDLIGRRSIK